MSTAARARGFRPRQNRNRHSAYTAATMNRPCPVSASVDAHAVELDRKDAELRYEKELKERAFEGLVDDMMRGYEYPRRAVMSQINLVDVLMNVDREELAQAVYKAITEAPEDLSLDVEKLVKGYFSTRPELVAQKAQDLRREDWEKS